MEQKRFVTVTADNRDYVQCPLEASIEYDLAPRPQAALTDEAGNVVPAQIDWPDDDDEAPVIRWIEPSLMRGQTKRYTITGHRAEWPSNVRLHQQRDNIEVFVGGGLFTGFRYGDEWVRPFLHPLMGPTGPVTRGYPMEDVDGETQDHPHHKGCWVAHGDVNGCDIWAESEGHGSTTHEQLIAAESGPVFGHINTHNLWRNAAGMAMMKERRLYRFYHTPPGKRTFDMTVRFTALEEDVKFGDTKEGGICSVRVATAMDVPHGRFVNAIGGINEAECWGKRAPWCDYSGPVNGQTVGVAIFDHPQNYRYPTYWHVRNYGLMTANPFGLSYYAGNPGGQPNGDMTLAAEESITFRYRVLVHAGNSYDANVGLQYQQWINQPIAEIDVD